MSEMPQNSVECNDWNSTWHKNKEQQQWKQLKV